MPAPHHTFMNARPGLRLSIAALLLGLASLLFFPADPGLARPDAFPVLALELKGSINPAQVDLLDDALIAATKGGYRLLVITLDTPGGLGTSMREMVKMILNAPVPVGVWVGPAGASAASAGIFLVAASDIAGMSPQTTIGSAHPVSLFGQEGENTQVEKVIKDFLSLVRGIAAAKGRNVDWYERAVRENANVTGEEAHKQKVVEILSPSLDGFLEQAGERGIEHKGETIRFAPGEIRVDTHEPGTRHRFLSWLLDPQIAYFLLLGGLAGLFFELSNPGVFFPGVIGGICLILGLYAMAILPTNAAGFLLILMGVVLFVLEIFVNSFGLLSIAGIIALFIGSIVLYRVEYGFPILPFSTIMTTVVGTSLLIGLAIYLVARAQRLRPHMGLQAIVGQPAEVISWGEGKGQVLVRGELWRAVSPLHDYKKGETVKVSAVQGLTLHVDPWSGPPQA
jgi:membrane-bound serine protease (ClpP class)